jgi:hypothetical protein
MLGDLLHPNKNGHKLMGDMALYLLREAMLDLLLHPWGQQDQQQLAQHLPEPMYPGEARCCRCRGAGGGCVPGQAPCHWEHSGGAAAGGRTGLQWVVHGLWLQGLCVASLGCPIPPPLHTHAHAHTGNHHSSNKACLHQEAFASVVEGSQGWEFVNEGAAKNKSKWGYVAWEPGAVLQVGAAGAGWGGWGGLGLPAWGTAEPRPRWG